MFVQLLGLKMRTAKHMLFPGWAGPCALMTVSGLLLDIHVGLSELPRAGLALHSSLIFSSKVQSLEADVITWTSSLLLQIGANMEY